MYFSLRGEELPYAHGTGEHNDILSALIVAETVPTVQRSLRSVEVRAVLDTPGTDNRKGLSVRRVEPAHEKGAI
jgi:hypothetical protein